MSDTSITWIKFVRIAPKLVTVGITIKEALLLLTLARSKDPSSLLFVNFTLFFFFEVCHLLPPRLAAHLLAEDV